MHLKILYFYCLQPYDSSKNDLDSPHQAVLAAVCGKAIHVDQQEASIATQDSNSVVSEYLKITARGGASCFLVVKLVLLVFVVRSAVRSSVSSLSSLTGFSVIDLLLWLVLLKWVELLRLCGLNVILLIFVEEIVNPRFIKLRLCLGLRSRGKAFLSFGTRDFVNAGFGALVTLKPFMKVAIKMSL